MGILDLPFGILKRPLEPGDCSLCPDGGHHDDRAVSFCPVLEAPVCDECCNLMWHGNPYRLLTASARLGDGRDLGELLRGCVQCGQERHDNGSRRTTLLH